MPTWWDSIETVTAFTWWTRWVGLGVTFLGVLISGISLASTRQLETLKQTRDKTSQTATTEREAQLQKRLQAAEERQKDRHLTEEQKAALVAFLSASSKGEILIRCHTGDREARTFAQEIAAVLTASGWKVLGPYDGMLFASGAGSLPGLLMLLKDPQSPPERARILQYAYKEVGLSIPVVEEDLPPDTVYLYVNPKPLPE